MKWLKIGGLLEMLGIEDWRLWALAVKPVIRSTGPGGRLMGDWEGWVIHDFFENGARCRLISQNHSSCLLTLLEA